MSDTGGLVVNKEGGDEGGMLGSWVDTKKYGSAIIIVVLILVVASVAYCKQGTDGFASPDGVVARRSQRQVRSDTEVDSTWNLKELERSVALLNKKSGAYE
jgi:hypothetical protein